jgi:hypothetical protein
MADIKSGPEVKQEHTQIFGPILGPVYHELYNEVVWLHAKWLEYRKLYAKSEKRIALLNETAAFFFFTIEAVLRENVLLHIARLTDPPVQGKFRNLTLRRLPDLVTDKVLADDLQKLVAESLDRCKFARDLRDKQIAHSDLSFAVDVQATPLPGVSRQIIEDALASFRKIMNRLHEAYFQETEVAFNHFITGSGADALVCHLAEGVRSDKRRRERLRQGKPLPEDWGPPPEV